MAGEFSQMKGVETLTFSGYTWRKRDSGSVAVGPGPNRFSRENVFVDSNGWLHLRIDYRRGAWQCAQASLSKALGYGTYQFEVDTNLMSLASPIVLGLFTYDDDPAYDHREIDIEFSNGPLVGRPWPWQYVLQPYDRQGNLTRFAWPFPVTNIWHTFTWAPSAIFFRSFVEAPEWVNTFHIERSPLVFFNREVSVSSTLTFPGMTNAVNIDIFPVDTMFYRSRFQTIGSTKHPFETKDIRSGIPRTGNERVGLNLWLFQGKSPGSTNNVHEAVIKSFRFTPLGKVKIGIPEVLASEVKLSVEYKP